MRISRAHHYSLSCSVLPAPPPSAVRYASSISGNPEFARLLHSSSYRAGLINKYHTLHQTSGRSSTGSRDACEPNPRTLSARFCIGDNQLHNAESSKEYFFPLQEGSSPYNCIDISISVSVTATAVAALPTAGAQQPIEAQDRR